MAGQAQRANVDVVICGGGIAGLWTLDRLRAAGFGCLLLESAALGCGQTRHAQGIIHGGLKYALRGRAGAASEALRNLPSRWHACLHGEAPPDLREVRLLSPSQYLWSPGDLRSRIEGLFASRLLKARTTVPEIAERPTMFRHPGFRGRVWRLDEPVLDTASLVNALAAPHHDRITRIASVRAIETATHGLWLDVDTGQGDLAIDCRAVVLCAGAGNAGLLRSAGLAQPRMQTRPLHMVMVRGELPADMFAHCLGRGSDPRLTITSHPGPNGERVWYLGGALAETGVSRSAEAQIEVARAELAKLFPWLQQRGLRWSTLRIDRAEPRQADGRRPSSAYADWQQGIITAWPTKLALAPRLAEQVLSLLDRHAIAPGVADDLPPVRFPGIAPLPWLEETRPWH